MLSPSTIVITRRGTPRRDAMAVAATGSVGETIAPSTNADGHERPITTWATTATVTIVATTSPTASRVIGRRELHTAQHDTTREAPAAGPALEYGRMCGICGIATTRGAVDPGRLAAMSAALVHRGPDSDGVHLDAGVGLAARRLSIIDL